jgi:hypothetical protein
VTRPGFADRSMLSQWANTRQAQSEFPRLVRRLILETGPGVTELGMPAGDGVAAASWDGMVRSTASNPWIPAGPSVWELSVNTEPGSKAESDYLKRASIPDGSSPAECTYVQAILRPWTKRGDWATRKRSEGLWRDVRAYGLDDIETWLAAAPVTWAWFSEQLGLNPYGMQTAETRWRAWSSQTSPALNPDVVMAGRDTAVDAIQVRLEGGGISTLEGASLDEACAFLAAMAVKQDLAGEGSLLARLAFVEEPATWRSLLESHSALVLVPLNLALARDVPSPTHHAVLVPVTETRIADVELPPLNASGVADAFMAAGMDRGRANDAGRLARRSLTALRRNLANNPALHRPHWAEPPVSRQARAALLSGSWSDLHDGDKDVLGYLAGESYDAFREAAAELALEADPFIIQVGASWHLVSAIDAWILLVERLNVEDMERFAITIDRVLGEIDPSLDVPEEERWWKASFEGRVRAFSSDLRRGLARSLALLGVYAEQLSLSQGTSGSGWSAYLVASLLRAANEDATERTWASLSDLLPLLAEAAPDAVIDAITSGSSGPNPKLASMFTDSVGSGLFSSESPHTHLLWALERLAWSPEHFGAAIDLLARLAEIDPGGRLSNRPARSLAEIFCPWHPENSVTSRRRLRVIDQVRRRHPDVAWKLLLSMLPESHATHFPTDAPHFRDWKPLEATAPAAEYIDFVSSIVARCIEDAGTDGERWASVLSSYYSDLSPGDRAVVLNRLAQLADNGSLAHEDADRIWAALSELVRRHRQFADAQWALPEEALVDLDSLIDRLQPESAFTRHQWLFQDHMPDVGDLSRRDDFAAYETLVANLRREAVRDIEVDGGLDAVRRLAEQAEVKWSVGIALAEACPAYDDQLLALLTEDNASDVELAGQYFLRRFSKEGWSWFDELLQRHSEASPLQRARLLLAIRDLPRAWEVADQQGHDVAEHYWKLFLPYGLGADFDQVDFVAERLMGVGRNAMTVDFIHMYLSRDEANKERLAQLIAAGLDGLLAGPEDPELRALSSYDFQTSFEVLERYRDSIGVNRVARLEWGLLSALGHDPGAPTLHEAMSKDPKFFVDVVCAVYRSRDSAEEAPAEDATDDQGQARARNAYRLLSSWSHVPGLSESGIDRAELYEWLDDAQRLLSERGRLEVGLIHFGHVLASAPPDDDGTWPPRVVRDLLEDLHSDEVENGFATEILNRRGVTWRGLEEGGAQEEALAARYRADADGFADEWPRVAAVLRRLARSYEADARTNEDSAERFRRGLD